MRIFLLTIFSLTLVPAVVAAQQNKVYRWVDENGVVHYDDAIPPEASDYNKDVLNRHGVAVDRVQGKKTEEELEAERVAAELAMQKELQMRADRALLATYGTIGEIEMHRDRRVELFQAQSRVTELYLRNLNRRLDSIEAEASNYQPYSNDENAPMIDASLVEDLRETKDAIARHEGNLLKYRTDERQIIANFEGDISRFKTLKGID